MARPVEPSALGRERYRSGLTGLRGRGEARRTPENVHVGAGSDLRQMCLGQLARPAHSSGTMANLETGVYAGYLFGIGRHSMISTESPGKIVKCG